MVSSECIDLTHTLSMHTTPHTIYPGDPPLAIRSHCTIAADGYSVHALSLGTHTGTHLDAPKHFVESGEGVSEIGLERLVGRALVVDYTLDGGELSVEGMERRRIEWDELEDVWRRQYEKTGVALKTLGEMVDCGVYKMLLVNTGWGETHYPSPSSRDRYDPARFFAHPYFAPSVAQRLMEPSSSVRLFGCDTPSPDETPWEGVGGEGGFKFHEVVLGGGGLILENAKGLGELARALYLSGSQSGSGSVEEERKEDWIVNVIPLKLEGLDGSPVRAFAYRKGAV